MRGSDEENTTTPSEHGEKFLCLRVTLAQDIILPPGSSHCCLYVRVGNYRANSCIVSAESEMEFSIELLIPYGSQHIIYFLLMDCTSQQVIAQGRFPDRDEPLLSCHEAIGRLISSPCTQNVALKPAGRLSVAFTTVEPPKEIVRDIHLTLISFHMSCCPSTLKNIHLVIELGDSVYKTNETYLEESNHFVFDNSFKMPYQNEQKLRFTLKSSDQGICSTYGTATLDLWGVCGDYSGPVKGSLPLVTEKDRVIGKLRFQIVLDKGLQDEVLYDAEELGGASSPIAVKTCTRLNTTVSHDKTLFKRRLQEKTWQQTYGESPGDVHRESLLSDCPGELTKKNTTQRYEKKALNKQFTLTTLLAEAQMALVFCQHVQARLHQFAQQDNTLVLSSWVKQAQETRQAAEKNLSACRAIHSDDSWLKDKTPEVYSLAIQKMFDAIADTRSAAEDALRQVFIEKMDAFVDGQGTSWSPTCFDPHDLGVNTRYLSLKSFTTCTQKILDHSPEEDFFANTMLFQPPQFSALDLDPTPSENACVVCSLGICESK